MSKATLTIQSKVDNITSAIEFIENSLISAGYEKKQIMKPLLISEEILLQMIQHGNPERNIAITINGFKNKSITIKARGIKFDGSNYLANNLVDIDTADNDDEQTSLISRYILKSYTDEINLKHRNGYNILTIKVPKKKVSNPVLTYLVAGIVFGLVLRFLLPQIILNFISVNIFSLISSIFMTGIGVVVAPLVFFSVAESVSGFSDIKTFGKVGAKVMGFYTLTSIIAMIVSYIIQAIMKPGSPALVEAIRSMNFSTDSVESAATISLSLKDTILNMFPSNIVDTFLRSDMIQIIVIAAFIGLASGAIGEYSEPVQNFIKAGNALFSKIVTYVLSILPVAVFCLMANLIVTIDFSVIGGLVTILATNLVSYAAMILAYCVLIILLCRINPLKFLANQKEAMMLAFSSCSSAAVMPVNMKCLDRFGISSKIYSFSIPLGSTVNMDGTVVIYMVLSLALTRIYSINLTGPALASFFFSVFLLSIGTPCVAGAGIAVFMLILTQLGIPIEAMAIVIPITTMLDFFATTVNVTGDSVCTLIVANSEKLFNKNK